MPKYNHDELLQKANNAEKSFNRSCTFLISWPIFVGPIVSLTISQQMPTFFLQTTSLLGLYVGVTVGAFGVNCFNYKRTNKYADLLKKSTEQTRSKIISHTIRTQNKIDTAHQTIHQKD